MRKKDQTQDVFSLKNGKTAWNARGPNITPYYFFVPFILYISYFFQIIYTIGSNQHSRHMHIYPFSLLLLIRIAVRCVWLEFASNIQNDQMKYVFGNS